MSTKTEALEAKLEAKKLARAEEEEAQYEKDLEARLELEDTHEAMAAVKVSRFVNGQPTFALVRMPTTAEYKRYKDLTHRAAHAKNVKGAQDACDQLGRACWVYPAEEEEQKAMLEAFPGLVSPLYLAASGLAEGRSEDEGKG